MVVAELLRHCCTSSPLQQLQRAACTSNFKNLRTCHGQANVPRKYSQCGKPQLNKGVRIEGNCSVCSAAPASFAGVSLPLTEGWNLWAVLAIIAAVAQVLQARTKLGGLLSAPLLAILLGLVLSAIGVIPISAPAYDTIWVYLLPLAAALYLLESDLRELAVTAKDTLIAFLIATFATIAGTVIAWAALGHLLGNDGWKVSAALCGSYIGGSVNFAAVAAALGLSPGPLLAAAMAADNIAMAGYLALISVCPADLLKKQVPDGKPSASTLSQESPNGGRAAVSSPVSAESVAMSLAAAALACALGSGLAQLVGAPGFSLAFVAIIASGFASAGATLNPRASKFGGEDGAQTATPFAGAEAVGGALMLLFFATIGAAAGSIQALLQTGWLFAFITIQLSVHLAITLGFGRFAGLPMQAILTASNAAVGGPGTAAAMASARGWSNMLRPALICGALGYSIGTGLGVSVGHFIAPAMAS